jgi:hypothetical protein
MSAQAPVDPGVSPRLLWLATTRTFVRMVLMR